MILYDLCLLPAQCLYVIINIRYLESHVQHADRCALWKFTSGGENLVLHPLQFCRPRLLRGKPAFQLTSAGEEVPGGNFRLRPQLRAVDSFGGCRSLLGSSVCVSYRFSLRLPCSRNHSLDGG
jgi:hypothetical protein